MDVWCLYVERVYEYFESGRMTRQFEQSHDPYDAEKLQDVVVLQVTPKLTLTHPSHLNVIVCGPARIIISGHLISGHVVVLLEVVEQEVEVEAEGGYKVDDVDWCQDERTLVRTHHEPNTQRNAPHRNATQRNAPQRNAPQRNATQRTATQRNAT